MKPWQITTLGIILLSGYAIFAVGGYLTGANATEQKWQARVAYIAYAEERVCHLRSRNASDASAMVAAEAPTADVCALFQESEGALGTQAAIWKSVTPPDEWQGWHADILSATEAMSRGYEHLLVACQHYDEWEFNDSVTELSLGVDLMLMAAESLEPERRPWAAY